MSIRKSRFLPVSIMAVALLVPHFVNAEVSIIVHPDVSISIGGKLVLDRSQFINLASKGSELEAKVQNIAQVDDYVDTLGMNFGREFGGIYGVTIWNSSAVREDPLRPGYVDIPYLISRLNPSNGGASQSFQNRYAPNIGLAAHDRVDSYPDFMPYYLDGSSSNHRYPTDVDAASEYVAAVLEHNYTDWTRPATYEIVNEPHWRVQGDQRFADLHTAVNAKVDAAGLDVAVGGPCMSVGYFYKNNYQKFDMKGFIDNTQCSLDFYSFHIYDYMSWDAGANDFNGRVSTGLPIEGVLDLIQNYTLNQYSKNVEIVLSEHGGYISNDQEGALDTVANAYFPGSGFEWELKRRSVSEFIGVSSAIANTMVFMNNPHVVRKAVPFILLESAAWNPRYYSTLLVKENFDNQSNVWHESTYINFFKLFKNVSGRRVRVEISDPDIQIQAYVMRDKLYIVMNNLARKAESLDLNIPQTGIERIDIRRFGRNVDFTPYFAESAVADLEGIEIAGREAIALEIDYAQNIAEELRVNEVPYYADQIQQSFTGTRTFNLTIPSHENAMYAKLRIGVGRSPGTDRHLAISLNGTSLTVPLEDCASYLENDSEYGSTKLVNVPVNLLQENNEIEVEFPNNGSGGIGSIVMRTAFEYAPLNQDGDAYNDEEELIAGTDPNDSASYLKMNVGTDPLSGKPLIEWESIPGKVYDIFYNDEPENASYELLQSDLRHPQNSYTDPSLPASHSRLYKLSAREN